ncbi:hypothetical protein [Agaribacterium haliotis]|uniref:hypothetical protein n=1 Tax=Agaribacterium haliotis TaxID=2013869 RepID=UPI000BB586D9|nr:hypothetical protein [Agaribacterium haliotis]
MFSLFTKTQIVDDATSENLRISFDWAQNNFDNEFFLKHSVLVLPSRDFFPDRADNAHDMATALCQRILSYAGLEHWPFALIKPEQYIASAPRLLQLATQTRGGEKKAQQNHLAAGEAPNSTLSSQPGKNAGGDHHTLFSHISSFDYRPAQLELSYSAAMMKKPMDLVGSMSKNIAQHYLWQSQLVPPTGPEGFDASAELLAIFMGFGVFIANSAYTFRGSCARCYDPSANRTAALSEDEALYSLALFCQLKNIDNKAVLPSLKTYLRPAFKKARKQVRHELAPAR